MKDTHRIAENGKIELFINWLAKSLGLSAYTNINKLADTTCVCDAINHSPQSSFLPSAGVVTVLSPTDLLSGKSGNGNRASLDHVQKYRPRVEAVVKVRWIGVVS